MNELEKETIALLEELDEALDARMKGDNSKLNIVSDKLAKRKNFWQRYEAGEIKRSK